MGLGLGLGLGVAGGCRGSAERDAVLRLLRGEDLDTVSRSLGVAAATLSSWRDAFLDGGEPGDQAGRWRGARERPPKARLGEMLLKTELLEQKIALLEGNSGPLGRRRSRR